MKQEEIIEMARQAGFDFNQMSNNLYTVRGNYAQLEAFVNLVADKEQKKWQDQTAIEIHETVLEEREACAKVAEHSFGVIGSTIALAIRARGEA